jgi:hypothetical protein
MNKGLPKYENPPKPPNKLSEGEKLKVKSLCELIMSKDYFKWTNKEMELMEVMSYEILNFEGIKSLK